MAAARFATRRLGVIGCLLPRTPGQVLVSQTILQASPHADYEELRAEIDAAVAGVLSGGRYILGPETAAFEREFAAYTGAAHALGLASGTDAAHLGLRALGVGPGDEVITTPHTATATVAAIDQSGATP